MKMICTKAEQENLIDCVNYNWKKHCCSLGAHEEGKPSDSFYQDCPLGLHEEDEDVK